MKVDTNKFWSLLGGAIGLLMLTFLVIVGHPPQFDDVWLLCISIIISNLAVLTRKPLYLDLERRQLTVSEPFWFAPKVYAFDSLQQFSVQSDDFLVLELKLRRSEDCRAQTIRILKSGLDGYDLQQLVYVIQAHQE